MILIKMKIARNHTAARGGIDEFIVIGVADSGAPSLLTNKDAEEIDYAEGRL